MTSTQIVTGTAPSRPNRWPLNAGKDVLLEAAPGGLTVLNSGAGRATAVETTGDDEPVGGVTEIAVGGTLSIAAGKRYRVSALSGLVLQLAWT